MAVYGGDRYGDFVSHFSRRFGEIPEWTATQKFACGDLVLFYFTKPKMSVIAVGLVSSPPKTIKRRFAWTKRRKSTFCDFRPVWLLRKGFLFEKLCFDVGLERWCATKPYRNSRKIAPDIALKLLSRIALNNPAVKKLISRLDFKSPTPNRSRLKRQFTSSTRFFEGGPREIAIELQQRDRRLRAQAIAVYGDTCRVCNFNFGEYYGELGGGYVEVHHLKPLSARKRKREVTIQDVDVVCANCHRVLHRNGKKPISLDQLRSALKRREK